MIDLEQQLTEHLRHQAAVVTPRYDLDAIVADTRPAAVVRIGDDTSGLPSTRRRRVWAGAAAAALVMVTGSVVVLVARAGDDRSVSITDADTSVVSPSTTTDLDPTTESTASTFVGDWVSTDTDGSLQTMEIVASGEDGYEIVSHDDVATAACSGGPATITGIGRLDGNGRLVIAQPSLSCDDGTEPGIGPPPQTGLADLGFELDPITDQLTDTTGNVWQRTGTPNTPATTTPPTTEPEPATAATVTLSAEEIRVTPDLIEYGDNLVVVVDRVARDAGLVYVLAGRVGEPGQPAGEPRSFGLFDPNAVLAAFDDAGAERWRIELDGTPTDVVVVDGDPWVLQHDDRTVSRIDAADGRVLGQVTLDAWELTGWMYAAYGAVWIGEQGSPDDAPDLVRIDPDLTTTSIELPGESSITGGCDSCRGARIASAAGAVWVPLMGTGVAMVDPGSNEVTVIPADRIGHEAHRVAADGDAVFVTSFLTSQADRLQVTSIVDRQVRGTAILGDAAYVGPLDGAFGALLRRPPQMLPDGTFQTLKADNPMIGEEFEISGAETNTYGLAEIDGEAWIETLGPGNWGLRRLQFPPATAEDG